MSSRDPAMIAMVWRCHPILIDGRLTWLQLAAIEVR